MPCHRMSSNGTFKDIDILVLFYIFYFEEDEYQRLLAARELQFREWTFHKKLGLWFKRSEKPTK